MIAVLTGDIVASTSMPTERQEAVMEALRGAASRAARWHGSDLRFTRQKGDGWQACLARPELAPRTALYFQAALRELGKDVATRISIGLGAAELGPGQDLNSATGSAFIASGRGLEDLEGAELIRHSAGGALAASVRLADHISQGWTSAQARAIHPMLDPLAELRHSDVARSLGISRQAVTQALDSAGFAALSQALAMIEARDDDR